MATRERFGDWEGDTLEGRKGGDAVVSLVERKARFTILCRVQDRSSAALNEAVKKHLGRKRNLPRLTLTVDRGGEFRDGKALGKAFKGEVYFTDPHSPWQKGRSSRLMVYFAATCPRGLTRRVRRC